MYFSGNQSLREPSSPQRLTSHADKPVISNVAPIWNPKKGAIIQKKEYKPIKLDTLGRSTMEIQKQHEENQKVLKNICGWNRNFVFW